MREYWQTINSILDSVTALQENRYHSVESLEIKESADSLQISLQPCIRELLDSSNRLNCLIDDSLEKLEQAKAIWISKEKISNVDTAKVWQEITILTGLSAKIQCLANEQKNYAIEEAEETCQAMFNKLEKKYFRDKKGLKYKIGWSDKDAFNKAVRPKVSEYYSEKLNKISTKNLKNYSII